MSFKVLSKFLLVFEASNFSYVNHNAFGINSRLIYPNNWRINKFFRVNINKSGSKTSLFSCKQLFLNIFLPRSCIFRVRNEFLWHVVILIIFLEVWNFRISALFFHCDVLLLVLLSKCSQFGKGFELRLFIRQWVLWISCTYPMEVVSINDDSPLLKDPIRSLVSRSLDVPNEFLLVAILNSLESLLPLWLGQEILLPLIESPCNNVVSASDETVAIKIIT